MKFVLTFFTPRRRHGVWLPVALACLVGGCSRAPHVTAVPATPATPPASSAAATSDLNVNDIAASPEEHLGHLQFIGAVADVNAGSGFIVVDQRVPGACDGADCANGACADTAHIPVQWTGPAPAVQQVIEVTGRLETNAQGGLSMIAEQVKTVR